MILHKLFKMEWNCYNCKKGVKKGLTCICKNKEANWRCRNCDKDIAKGFVCSSCKNNEAN